MKLVGLFDYRRNTSFTTAAVVSILLALFIHGCSLTQLNEGSTPELLWASGFRLLDSPNTVIPWKHRYRNRTFPLPVYRTPEGVPLPGWRYHVIVTRRFFTDQSSRIYYRIEDLQQSRRFKSLTPASGLYMRIWPLGAMIVQETYSGRGAYSPGETPLAIDCMRKFASTAANFPVNTLFAGEWSYQQFSADGRAVSMPGGATACHQCHITAIHLTGDVVFTLFSDTDNNVQKSPGLQEGRLEFPRGIKSKKEAPQG